VKPANELASEQVITKKPPQTSHYSETSAGAATTDELRESCEQPRASRKHELRASHEQAVNEPRASCELVVKWLRPKRRRASHKRKELDELQTSCKKPQDHK